MEPIKRRRSDRALRERMRSPGRPGVGNREYRRKFWEEIARGLSSEESAVASGVSQAVGSRWFRECGGMRSARLRAPSRAAPTSARVSLKQKSPRGSLTWVVRRCRVICHRGQSDRDG